MPSTPLTCSSIGAATVSRTVRALAPGYEAVTTTVGGVTSGYWATGSVTRATAPARVMTMDRTDAKIGRSMKKREITGYLVSKRRHPPERCAHADDDDPLAPPPRFGEGAGGRGLRVRPRDA